MIGIEDGPGGHQVEMVVTAHTPGQVEDGVEPGANPPVLRGLGARAFQPVDLALDRGQRFGGEGAAVQAVPVVLGQVVLAGLVAELLADGGQLLAQEELALVALHALAHVGPDLLAHLGFGEGVLHPGHHLGQPGVDIDGLQQLDAAFQGQVGPPAGAVRQRAGGFHVAEHGGHARAAQLLQQQPGRGPVLAGQLLGPGARRRVVDRLDLDPQGIAGADHARSHQGASFGPHHQGRGAVGEGSPILDPGDGPHPGELPVDAGQEQHAVIVADGIDGGAGLRGLEGDGDHHLGEHDTRAQGQDR